MDGISTRHNRTLKAIFGHPVPHDIPGRDVEALFHASGGKGAVSAGRGSRRRVSLGGEVSAVFHEPHPERVTDRGAISSVRKFLERAGVRP